MARLLHCTCSVTALMASCARFGYLPPFASSLYKGISMHFTNFIVIDSQHTSFRASSSLYIW